MDFAVETWVKLAAYTGGGIAMGFGAMGAAIGEGYTAAQANLAISTDVRNSGNIVKNMLVGQAVAESASIFALVVAILLLFVDVPVPSLLKAASLLAAGISMGFGAIGAGIGSGIPGGDACLGIARKPEMAGRFTTTMLIGSAVCQTPAIFAMVIALVLMFMDFGNGAAHLTWAAHLGAGICMGFGAIGSGIGSGFPGGRACLGMAEQPEAAPRLTTTMLIGSAVCQTPAIFAMVVALILMFMNFTNAPLYPTWAALFGAGISTGLAAIGSGIGGGLAAGASCEGIARNPETVGKVTTIMLVGQAVSQTPSIFGLLVSFILIFKAFPESYALSAAMALLGAGICMGFGGIGPGIGNGMTAESAVRWVARNVEHAGDLMRTMLVGQAVSQSTAIYAMVISLVLIFVV
ncbi:MAG: ATP synthase F0 subunit C [Desulfobacterales bacterium]|jgi:ATP synthase F0 subunit c